MAGFNNQIVISERDFEFQKAQAAHFRWNAPYCQEHGNQGELTYCDCGLDTYVRPEPEFKMQFSYWLQGQQYRVEDLSYEQLVLLKLECQHKLIDLEMDLATFMRRFRNRRGEMIMRTESAINQWTGHLERFTQEAERRDRQRRANGGELEVEENDEGYVQ